MAEPMKSDLQRAETHAYAATALAVALVVLGAILLTVTQARALQPALLATGMTAVVAVLGAFRLRLARRQQDEESAVAAFRASHTTSAELFADADEAVKIVSRANRTYVTWILPILTALAGAGLLLGGGLLWRDWTALAAPAAPLKPLLYAGFASPFLAALILAGSYFSGVSREPGCRWLRPVGAWLLFTGALYGLAILALILIDRQLPVPRLDLRAGRIGLALLLLFGGELLLNVIIDLYRPRIPGEAERPVTESRLLTLVTEPGGIARNVATALDYQFGFKVTDVWFYRFLERTVVPFAGLALLLFWLMSSIVVIQPQQCGIHQRLGRVLSQAPLQPGLQLKWPWPIDTIHLFPVERIQEVPVGYNPAGGQAATPPGMSPPEMMGDPSQRVIVWGKQHDASEFKFAVASSHDSAPVAAADAAEGRVLPIDVSFLAASIPLYFRVNNLYDNQFRNRDSAQTLQALASRETTRYLTNVDYAAILSAGRGVGGEELRRRIQAAADQWELGVTIVAVGLQGIHPPAEVGKAYDGVAAAMEEMHETVLKATTKANKDKIERAGQDTALLGAAQAYRHRRIQVAQAEADRFAMQLKAYQASPEMFALNSYLDILQGSEGRAVRKYVLGGQTGRRVTILNLETKLRPDLLDLDFNQPQ